MKNLETQVGNTIELNLIQDVSNWFLTPSVIGACMSNYPIENRGSCPASST
ncbi:unnamed protein product [Nesidiocoris tenuis]|uniref:Uncharacterized protein n=1 Tax=Nesidiocoris tenuis TaxID=355587 RepID=A0A6H5H677_9HEMI|nr:unnamed protein product [Nesidiocoris tenuis]